MTEPVAIAAVVRALLLVLATFGLVKFTDADTEQIIAGMSGVVVIVEAVAAWWTRRKVTPLAAPKVPDGTTVEHYPSGFASGVDTTGTGAVPVKRARAPRKP